MQIPLIKPYIPASALDAVAAVLASGHLSEGPVTARLEAAFATFCGAAHAVAVTSCTTGLELALRALEIGPGDEVVVPGYTYPATAQAVMLTGATAVIADCDPRTLDIDYDAMEDAITPRTRCLMPVSLFGNPLDWDRLDRMAARHGLPVVEDAACGFGSAHRGRRTGSMGTMSVFSLHPRKSITTGEGGMITTGDDALAARLRSMKRFGLEAVADDREAMRFVRLGTNLKLSDIVAAVGLAQMDEAAAMLARRAQLAARYRELLPAPPPDAAGHPAGHEASDQLRWPDVTPGGEHGWQSCCVLVPHRDRVLRALRAEGVEAQIGTYALHREPLFRNHPLCRIHGATHGSQQAYDRTLALPLYHHMTDAQQAHVAARLAALLAEGVPDQPDQPGQPDRQGPSPTSREAS